jgi:hypothetical protein
MLSKNISKYDQYNLRILCINGWQLNQQIIQNNSAEISYQKSYAQVRALLIDLNHQPLPGFMIANKVSLFFIQAFYDTFDDVFLLSV